MLDPDAAETFLDDISSHEDDHFSPVQKVDRFFEGAERAVGDTNSRVGNVVGGWRNKLLCRGPPTEEEEKRKVTLNNSAANKQYATNFVSTAKYHLFSAVPKFLYEQFVLRIANSYFLLVGILYCFDSISPVLSFSRYGQLIAVAFIISVSLIKETVEDSRRHIEDRRINRLMTYVLGPKGKTTWGRIKVGDIVKIHKNEPFPADLVLLYAESEDGLAFVETKQLDGESNLKVKASVHEVSQFFNTEEKAIKAQGFVESEGPNPRLNSYHASITLVTGDDSAETWGLTIDNLLVRGCRLRQTPSILGVVVNTGRDTKLLRNIKPKPKKLSSTEQRVNFLLFFPILLQTIIIVTLTSMNAVTCRETLRFWYLEPEDLCTSLNFFLRFFTFFTTFANLIPISLYVSIEVVRGLQVYFMTMDNEMMDTTRDEPLRMHVRTSNLTDELGILTHLFSDKTGTLTANDMVFKKCYVGESIYEVTGEEEAGSILTLGVQSTTKMRDKMSSAKTEMEAVAAPVGEHYGEMADLFFLREFHYVLALCQTVVPDGDGYQAASPDEAALVMFARSNGFRFMSRSNKSIFIRVFDSDEEWELLGLLDFNSTRKRMSVIVRSPHDKKIRVYTKGADTVIFQRSDPSCAARIQGTKEALNNFACDGLRTLCLAYKQLTDEFFDSWQKRWAHAITSDDREELCASLSEEIESNLYVLGCTAIEDRLQDNVKLTLEDMDRANIKVWVLTGDKQETAINIGLSCGVLDEVMDVVVMNEDCAEDTEAQLDKAFGRWSYMMRDGKTSRHFGLVVDGRTLDFILKARELSKKLVLLGKICKTVIACRVSPKQKADVVDLVRRYEKNAVTCAVGDGANDVAMIQAAHVGVGIVGVEGLEAKLASDFAIGQFQYLRRLFFVHGRWCYKRICRVICYMVYKNILLITNDFYFAFATSFSGQPLADPWIMAAYNVLLTSMPIVAVGVYDTDVSALYALQFPEVYRRTQARTALRITVFIKWVLSGVWQGSAIYWLNRAVLSNATVLENGQSAGLFSYGVLIFTQVVVVAHVSLMAYQSSWTLITAFFTVLSLTVWFWLGPLMSSKAFASTWGITPTLLGVVPRIFASAHTWLMILLTTTICVIPGHAAKYFNRNYRPTTKTLVQELMARKLTREDIMGDEKKESTKQMPTFSRRDVVMPVSSFVFDSLHQEENGESKGKLSDRRLSDSAVDRAEMRKASRMGRGHRRAFSEQVIAPL